MQKAIDKLNFMWYNERSDNEKGDLKMLDKNYYLRLDAEGCIRIVNIVNDKAIYYIDLTSGIGYCEIADGHDYYEYYCENEDEFMDYVYMIL